MTVTLAIIPNENLNFVVVHEVVDDKVEKFSNEISLKEAVEMQFCKINNFVNDYVKDWCYVQNIFKKIQKSCMKVQQ